MRHSRPSWFPSTDADCADQPDQPTILTIDDDPNISQALRRRFGHYRVTLLQAHHGTHGIWLATTRCPDVVITDLRMPQGRGQDVVARLIRHPHTRRIPIVVLTGMLDNELRYRMLNLGVAEYLIKPVSFEDLCNALRRFIELKEKEDEDQPTDGQHPLPAAAC
jgi:two-component system OmpR family response regulator